MRETGSSTAAGCSAGQATRPVPVASIGFATRASRFTCQSHCTPRATGSCCDSRDPLDSVTAGDWGNYTAARWQYKRTQNYGSEDYKVSDGRRQGHDRVRIEDVALAEDGRSVLLKMRDMQPAMQMELKYRIQAADGTPLAHTIEHTIHQVGDAVALEGGG